MIYVGEGDDHPGLYRRALRIAPGELHWIDPLRELKTGESRRFGQSILDIRKIAVFKYYVNDRSHNLYNSSFIHMLFSLPFLLLRLRTAANFRNFLGNCSLSGSVIYD